MFYRSSSQKNEKIYTDQICIRRGRRRRKMVQIRNPQVSSLGRFRRARGVKAQVSSLGQFRSTKGVVSLVLGADVETTPFVLRNRPREETCALTPFVVRNLPREDTCGLVVVVVVVVVVVQIQ